MVNDANMDFRIPGLPHSVVKHAQSTSVRDLVQKIENHPDRHALQQDLRQNQAYNPFRPRIKENDSGCWVTSNYVNGSRRNPTRSAKRAYHTGIPVWSIARAGTSCVKEEGWNVGIVYGMRAFLAARNRCQSRIHQLYDGSSFTPRVCHQEGKTSWPQIWGKKPGDKEYYLANQLKKKCKKKKFQGIHDRFWRDHEFRVRMIENHRDEEVCRRWMILQMKITLTHLSEKNTSTTRTNGGSIPISRVLDTLPLRNRSDFKQASSILELLHQEAGEEPYVPTYSYKHKQWQLAQSSSSTWWNWQDSWWSS